MIELILSETFLAEKTTFTLVMLTLLFRMGHKNFTHRLNFQKQQSITMTFIFSSIEIFLLKFSPQGIVSLIKNSAFSGKFMRIQS